MFNVSGGIKAWHAKTAIGPQDLGMDLYQRLSLRVKNLQSREIINKIANEEKAHLVSLGKLMDSL